MGLLHRLGKAIEVIDGVVGAGKGQQACSFHQAHEDEQMPGRSLSSLVAEHVGPQPGVVAPQDCQMPQTSSLLSQQEPVDNFPREERPEGAPPLGQGHPAAW